MLSSAPTCAPQLMSPVLHIDVDTFFCQVNYAARAAGVKKHMAPKEARNLLQAVGGVVHHVHMEAGGRVSYGPYRDVSKQLISRLRKFTGVGVIEKASIDECYIQYSVEGRHQDFDTMTAMQKAAQLAGTIRRTVLEELNLVVSIGLADNKMVAKLASLASKPDGMLVIDSLSALQQLLSTTPASRLPRCGGKVAETLTRAGVHTVADLQAWRAQQLQQDLGFPVEQAQQLSEWSRGQDSALVAERPPPKTLSIQMTLTPIPLVMHPSMGRDIAVAGGQAGLLEPLPVGAPNFRERLDSLLAAMGADILGRVMGDKLDEDRWPQKFELQMRAFRNSDRKSKTAVRSCSFPSPSLLMPMSCTTTCDASTGSGSQLEAALLANAVKLSKVAAAGLPADWNLVQVEMAATNFSAFSAAAAPSIHKFLQPALDRSLPANVATAPSVASHVSQEAVGAEQAEVCSLTQAPAPNKAVAVREQEGAELLEGTSAQLLASKAANLTQFSEAEIRQQQEMFRELELRRLQRLTKQNPQRKQGVKRTQNNDDSVRHSKVRQHGQRTISGLFGNAASK